MQQLRGGHASLSTSKSTHLRLAHLTQKGSKPSHADRRCAVSAQPSDNAKIGAPPLRGRARLRRSREAPDQVFVNGMLVERPPGYVEPRLPRGGEDAGPSGRRSHMDRLVEQKLRDIRSHKPFRAPPPEDPDKPKPGPKVSVWVPAAESYASGGGAATGRLIRLFDGSYAYEDSPQGQEYLMQKELERELKEQQKAQLLAQQLQERKLQRERQRQLQKASEAAMAAAGAKKMLPQQVVRGPARESPVAAEELRQRAERQRQRLLARTSKAGSAEPLGSGVPAALRRRVSRSAQPPSTSDLLSDLLPAGVATESRNPAARPRRRVVSQPPAGSAPRGSRVASSPATEPAGDFLDDILLGSPGMDVGTGGRSEGQAGSRGGGAGGEAAPLHEAWSKEKLAQLFGEGQGS